MRRLLIPLLVAGQIVVPFAAVRAQEAPAEADPLVALLDERALKTTTNPVVASFLAGTQGWVEALSALIRVQGRRDEHSAIEATRRLVEAVRRDPSLRPVAESLSAIIPVTLRRGQRALADRSRIHAQRL